jgi:hypothetical protein
MTRQDALVAWDDYAQAIGLMSGAILGLAEPLALRPSAAPRAGRGASGPSVAPDVAEAATKPVDSRLPFAREGATHQGNTEPVLQSLADPGTSVLRQVRIQTGQWKSIGFIADFVVQIRGKWRVFDPKGAAKRWTKAQEHQVPVFEAHGGIAHKPRLLPKGGMPLPPSRVRVITPEALQRLQRLREYWAGKAGG